jgi:hypothetical protein
MKVRITALPKASSGSQVNKNLPQNTWYTDQVSGKGDISIGKTLQPVDTSQANVEAEKGEVAVADMNFDGIPEHFVVGGQRHYAGGTPLNLPGDSFIFSDTQKMKIKDPLILARFGASSGSYTPADLAKKYDLNKYRAVLYDKDADKIQVDTAEKMMQNYNLKLGELALVQESKKGFPQGIPTIAFPYLEATGIDPQSFLPSVQPSQDMQVAKYGGMLKAQGGGKIGEDNKGNFNIFQAGEDLWNKFKSSHQEDEKDTPWVDVSDYTIKNGIKYKNYGEDFTSESLEPSGKPVPDSKGNLYIDPETNEYIDGRMVESREFLFGEEDRDNMDYLSKMWDNSRNMLNKNITGNYEGLGTTIMPNNPSGAAAINYMTNPLNLIPMTGATKLGISAASLAGTLGVGVGKFLVKGVPKILKVVTKPAIQLGKWAAKNPDAATNLASPFLGAGISAIIASGNESPLPNNQGQTLKKHTTLPESHIIPTPVDTPAVKTVEPGKRFIMINGKKKYY